MANDFHRIRQISTRHFLIAGSARFNRYYLRSRGIVAGDAVRDANRKTYHPKAAPFIEKYNGDAKIDGLRFGRRREQTKTDLRETRIPSRNRIIYNPPYI